MEDEAAAAASPKQSVGRVMAKTKSGIFLDHKYFSYLRSIEIAAIYYLAKMLNGPEFIVSYYESDSNIRILTPESLSGNFVAISEQYDGKYFPLNEGNIGSVSEPIKGVLKICKYAIFGGIGTRLYCIGSNMRQFMEQALDILLYCECNTDGIILYMDGLPKKFDKKEYQL